ncbi:multifunctional beta-oxidation protein [Armillaria novae-zelandiae]|uniref:Multifunctional beta-oxidation protein n=1 Tax=Armillaria novae-zelandiae TaxID=153914 RepID=A0AA39PIZ5_9AGAR|nr:multifunctional beta-oxidation protein [Armillaria novae-zelandiae]
MPLSFKGHTAVITGAGGGLGKAYSLFFASRGANVVVNDFNAAAAQKVVDEIIKVGGKAVANTSSVTDGAAVIKTAVDAFGGVTILINNAGILRDKAFKNMTDKEWDQIMEVHLKGAFACTKAVWPIFRKQKFGRVVNTASAAGIYGEKHAHLVIGNFGQANYSAAKMGLIGFTKTLAREGAKYGIKAIAIAPMAASPMTETIMPPEMLAKLGPEFVPPFVAAVCHPEGPDASGRVFELGAGFIAEVRWERSDGAVFKTDASFTPSAIKARWDEIVDFSKPYYPTSVPDVDAEGKLALAAKLPLNPQSKPEVRFDGQTVIITGAGAGLGRIYALMYGKLGANVVVNDVSQKGANSVVEEVIIAGGKAVAAVCSAEDGDAIVKIALEKFGGVHVLVANAGVLRDKSFQAMTEQEWDLVLAVHLRGTFKCAKAVWPIFQKQTYGRLVTTCSQVGIYGNFGQANYSTAKAGIMSLTKTLAFEGRKYNILANVIAPSAGTAMTATVWPQEMVDAFKPDFIAPLVGYLTSKDNEETSGSLFEVLGGWAAQTRWQRSGGYGFPSNTPYTPEDVMAKWKDITVFDERATYPTTTADAMQKVTLNPNPFADPEDVDIVVEAKKMIVEPTEYSYTERDVILYNLGVGATEKELKWTFEGDEDFNAIPTFGVIPQFLASSGFPSDWLPDYNPAKLLHGEQFLSIKAPIPTSGELVTRVRLLEALDKGKAAAVTTINETRDKHTGALIFENQSTVFIRGSGGFGGKRVGKDRGAATAANAIPKRAPDAVLEEKTVPTQAALYRLSGDTNPLHILPEFAAMGGFDRPILHGLCSMGISGKHVFKTFGPFKDIKVRFAGVVYPGETLVTLMWKEGPKVVFLTKVKERDSVVLASAGVTLADTSERAKL